MAAVRIRDSSLFTDANLVSLWEMESNSNDSKGSNNGSDTSITYNSGNGKFLIGAGFASGSSSKIVVADSATLKLTGNFTVMAWAKTSTTGAFQFIFQSYSQNTNFAGYNLYIDNSNHASCVLGKNTGTTVNTDYHLLAGSANICDGNFHFLAMVWDGTNVNLYVDGASAATPETAFNAAYAATNYVRIGCQDNAGTEASFFDGAIDDVAIFSRGLTASEISNHFSGADANTTSGIRGYFDV